MLSYWEKSTFIHYDFIIIGGGIVGLSTALSCATLRPKAKILVLEKGLLPTGASTKNAGFACIGSLTEILDDLTKMPESEVLELVQLRKTGLRKLRTRLGDENLGYAENGSYELLEAGEEKVLNRLDEVNRLLLPVTEKNAFALADDKKSGFGFSQKLASHVISNTCEGELNTGKMMRSLILMAGEKGIEIKTGCEVIDISESDGNVVVLAHNGFKNTIRFTADRLAVCTNAFSKKLFSGLEVSPGRGQVLVTKPIENLPFKGIFHFHQGYYYFREIDGRVLFGGGRNVDVEGERTTEFGNSKAVQEALLDKLVHDILPGKNVEIDYWWSGIMAFGTSKFPILKALSPQIAIGVRMGGMGVAIGTEIGDQLAAMLIRE